MIGYSTRRTSLLAIVSLFFLCACGDGPVLLTAGTTGDNTGTGTGTTGTTGTVTGTVTGTPDPAGTGNSGGNTIASAAPNVVQMGVDGGPAGAPGGIFNIPYISVTICAPGSTTNCQTIDHIEVDTGSSGLRIIASVINQPVLTALQQEVTTDSQAPIAECVQFADGIAWGSVRAADVNLSGETGPGQPIQIIGDPNFPNIPTACASAAATVLDTVKAFGANGIIGVGVFVQDCGEACTASTQTGAYWSCPGFGGQNCGQVAVPLNQQVANPVASFKTDNNGVILEMPSVADTGATTASGALVFGIATQKNNTLGASKVYTTDSDGNVSINYKGVTYPTSFIDSGSNFNFIPDGSIATCTTATIEVFCPASELALTALVQGQNGVEVTVNFNLANTDNLLTANPISAAFDNVAAPDASPNSFDFGMPFFYGRNVFTAIEGTSTPGGEGPYFAF
jgi:Protein of unknown function (DUF3443)